VPKEYSIKTRVTRVKDTQGISQ